MPTRRSKATDELKRVEATLPDDVRVQYDRLVTSKEEGSIAAVEGQTCTACYTDVTAQMANDLRRGDFVLCKSCGRILYSSPT